MSQTVSTVSRSSRFFVFTALAKPRTVRGSARSRFCATSDMTRWLRTSHSTVSASSFFRPSAARPSGDLGADDGVVLLAPLADVVEEEREVEHLAVHLALEDARGDGQLLHQLAALDLGEDGDALDGVLVHRVGVVHVELHHRHDGANSGM
jgi:hypothetical protein